MSNTASHVDHWMVVAIDGTGAEFVAYSNIPMVDAKDIAARYNSDDSRDVFEARPQACALVDSPFSWLADPDVHAALFDRLED